MNKIIISLAIVFLVSSSAIAQENKKVYDPSVIAADGTFEDYSKVIDIFLTMIADNKKDEAVDFVFKNNKWFAKLSDNTDALKQEFKKLNIDTMGKFLGYEKLVEKSLAGRMVQIAYIARYERGPIQFTFQFYKAQDKWQTYYVKYDESISDKLELETLIQVMNMIKETK